jgi:hypothetical protein
MKRIPHLIAVVCLIVSLITMPAVASNSLVIEVVSRTAEPGDVIEVAISITANPAPGVSAIKDLRIELGHGLSLYYPQGTAAYNNGAGARTAWPFVAGGGDHAGGNNMMIPLMGRPSHMNISDSHIVFNFQDIGFPFNSTETGTLVSLRLKVADSFLGGNIGITVSGGAYGSINPSVHNKTPALVNGRVYVSADSSFITPTEPSPTPSIPDEDHTGKIENQIIVVPIETLSGMQVAQARRFGTVYRFDNVADNTSSTPLLLSLPYTLKPGENPDAVRVWHMDDRGNLTCQKGVYSNATGMIAFTAIRQGHFVVGYDPVLLWENIFVDLSPDDAHYEAIAFMNQRGLMTGYGNGRVGPHDKLTRAQIATLLWNLEGKPEPNGSAWFSDVAPGAWYHDAIQWAAENRVVNGIGGGRFAPDPYITRQETMQMLYNYAVNFNGYSIALNLEMPEYADRKAISTWAVPAVTRMVEAGVMFGVATNELKPTDAVDRGETAAMFRNFSTFASSELE